MRDQLILLTVLISLTAYGCKQLECADGTIERNGRCEAADQTTNTGICGPFTELQGDRCVPMFPPTQCEPGTTEEDLDPATGVITCKGTGTGGGCASQLACPTPTGATKQTICGQIYDFQDNTKFAAMMATGTRCDPQNPTTSGPCALQILAYDAIAFGTNPAAATPLPRGDVYIDDCGRYRVTDIETNGTGPFIGLGFDDANMPLGPAGVTVTAAVTTGKQGMTATRDIEGYIARQATAGMWQASGGPSLAGGIYALVFRQHKTGANDVTMNQAGVTVTKMGNTIPANDFYFGSTAMDRTTIDAAAVATGANGTVLVTNASVADSVSYSGQGGLGTGCRWELRAGASLPGMVFIAIFRKVDIIGMTCND
jgi:hypothetical protein